MSDTCDECGNMSGSYAECSGECTRADPFRLRDALNLIRLSHGTRAVRGRSKTLAAKTGGTSVEQVDFTRAWMQTSRGKRLVRQALLCLGLGNRQARVVRALDDLNGYGSVWDIAGKANLPPSVVLRILAALRKRWIVSSPSSGYRESLFTRNYVLNRKPSINNS